MLYKHISGYTNGNHPVETLSNGDNIVLTVPGGKPRLASQTRQWDCLVSLVSNGVHIDDLSFSNIFNFLEAAKAQSNALCEDLVTRIFEVGAGGEPAPPDFATQLTSSTGQPLQVTAEYLLYALKWIFVAEDRYYLSEADIDKLRIRKGRIMLLECFNAYIQGAAVQEVINSAYGNGTQYNRSLIDWQAVEGLRDYIFFLHQLEGRAAWQRTVTRGGRHQWCGQAIATGLTSGLTKLVDDNKLDNQYYDDAEEAILGYITRNRQRRGVDN